MNATLLRTVMMAASLAAGASPAHAHGDNKPAPAAPAAAEQTDWGIADTAARPARTISIAMSDTMRFMPDRISVQAGDSVRFVVRNNGRMLHEMVIGTPDSLARHAATMARFPDMQHDEAYMAHVEPGKTGEIVWHFNRAGRFAFGCLIAGHYEAGMHGTLTVTPMKGTEK